MRPRNLYCCLLLCILSINLVSVSASAHVYPENRIKAPKLEIRDSIGFGGSLNREVHRAEWDYTYEFTVRAVEIQLSYFGARYLEHTRPPRFTSPDPTLSANFILTNPQSFNLYTYSLNNPINLIDPDGKVVLKPTAQFWEGRPYSRYLPEWTPNIIRSVVEFLEPTPDDQITFGGAILPFAGAITSATGTAARKTITKISKSIVDDVIDETLTSSQRNLTSKFTLTADEALEAGEKLVGPGYKEIGKEGSGVFRSADKTKQFRMDKGSLSGSHPPNKPHVHLETYKPGAKKPTVNNHIPLKEKL